MPDLPRSLAATEYLCAQAHGIRIGGRPFFHVCHFLLLGLAASQRRQRFRMFYKNFTRVNI